MMLRRLILFVALLLAPMAAHAQSITPELVAEGPATPGGEVELAIQMRPKPGWHGYWLNPGDAGLPMDLKWQVPDGFSAGALRYPLPTRLTIAGLMNYVYERDYAVLVRLTVPASARGTIPIRASARWLACTDKICVPESGTFALDLPVGSGTPERARFDAWRRALPQPLSTPAKFELTTDKLRVAIPLPTSVALGEPYVYPITDRAVDYAGKQRFRRNGDILVAELPREGGGRHQMFAGVLALGDGRGLEFQAEPGAVPSGGQLIGETGVKMILLAVLGALAGGLLLNLMPCVFPILALKALHLAKAGGAAAEVRRDGLAYAAGAVVGTGALGGILLAIRASGDAAGWAFQLQDPRTIVILLLLATAITLNLLGLFTVPALGGRARPTGGFTTGALAAFVATPCAGPFLGAALGTALILPPIASLLVFAALGLGLAIPFVAVAFIPALRKRLPKPGPWMGRLQRFLAIPMGATAAACLWLLWRVGGVAALQVALIAVAILAVALAIAGLLQRKGKPVWWTAFAALGVAGIAIGAMPERSNDPARSVDGAEPWSEARVAQSLRQGHPVFVYFTADWCLTCKVNEAAAIDRAEVREAFRTAKVKMLAGDWTNGDPAITRFLEGRDRAGVPLYLWYEPDGRVEELPQVLTPGMLIDRARRARR